MKDLRIHSKPGLGNSFQISRTNPIIFTLSIGTPIRKKSLWSPREKGCGTLIISVDSWRARHRPISSLVKSAMGVCQVGRRFMVTIEPMHLPPLRFMGSPPVLLPVGPDWQCFTISSRMDMRWLWTISWELVPIKSSWGGAMNQRFAQGH